MSSNTNKMVKKKTLEEFISKSLLIHKNKFTYECVELKNYSTKVNITCNIHGQFLQTPSKHVLGQGCPKCSISRYRETNLLLRGVDHPMKDQKVKDKLCNTNMKNLGVKWVTQHQLMIEKSGKTCIKNYGVSNPMQNSEIYEKNKKKSFKMKNYIFPSGRIDKVQGYEPLTIDELMEEGIQEDDILTSPSNVPELWYFENFKRRRYYTDIYIKSQNKCIEVKSSYLYKKDFENIKLKAQATIDLGYIYEIRVYNNKKKRQNISTVDLLYSD